MNKPHLPNVCPFCGQKGNFEYSKEYFHNDTVVFPWKCDCGASGREVYNLDFVGHENLEKGDNTDPCDNCNKPCCYGCEHCENDEEEENYYAT